MEDDEVPDLDDMSELVQGIKLNQQMQPGSNIVKTEPKTRDVIQVTEETRESQEKEPSVRPKQFGGMRKGFLSGGTNPSKSKPVENKVPVQDENDVIAPKNSPEKDSLVFDEVQQVMKGVTGVHDGWITGDLMKQVVSNEKLVKQMADPRISEAVTWMQTDPKAAMEYYKNDGEIRAFFKEFYKILGNHFTQLGDKQTQEKEETLQSSQLNSEDEKAVEDILADPEMKEILMKPDVQKLIGLLRNDPEEGQKFLNETPSLGAYINKLVSAGVLGFQKS